MKKTISIYDGTFDEVKFDEEMLACKTHDGLMSKEDKIKLDSLAGGEDSTITAKDVVTDSDHCFVTEKQKASWDAKAETKEDVGLSNVTNDAQVKRSEMGVANGVATLDDSGLIPVSFLPGFVSDIIEAEDVSRFPAVGESDKLYVSTSENKSYRWTGTRYQEIVSSVALGETSATAYAGDKGKAVADAVNAIVDGTTVVPKATDASTVSGFTIGKSVPEDAVFTDTVYTHPETHPAEMITENDSRRFATAAQLEKVDAIPADPKYTDTVYEHPETHPATMIVEDETHKFATAEELAKVDAIPNDPKYTDTVYVHPESHPATMITEDTDHKFVSEAQIAKIDAIPTDPKYTDTVYTHPETHPATMIVEDDSHKFATTEELAKVDAIPEDPKYTDTVYTHPDTHPATMITEDTDHKFVSEAQIATWDVKADDVPRVPYYDQKFNTLFACGIGIKVEASETAGKTKITWEDATGTKKLEIPQDAAVYGGAYGADKVIYYPGASITMNSGTLYTIYGGCLSNGTVGDATIIVNGGNLTAGINGGGCCYNNVTKKSATNTVGHVEIIINNTDSEILVVYGGGQGYSTVGTAKVTVNGGKINYLTAGGSNGHTGSGEVVVNGGSIKVLQGCNRGSMANIKLSVHGGTIGKLYAGGETEDSGVTATYVLSEVHITGGTITHIYDGTNGGVEDASKVSGTYVDGVVSDSEAVAMNLSKVTTIEKVAANLIDTAALEGKVLVLKHGDTVIASVDLSSINA